MQSVRRVWPLAGLVLLLPGVARAQPLGRVDPDESSVTVNLASAPADGVSEALVTVQVRDRHGRALRNRSVTLLAAGPGGVQLRQPEARTDALGIARGAVRSTAPGVAILTARVGPLSDELPDHPSVTFTPAPGLAWLRHGVGDSLALGVARLDGDRVAVVGDLRWTPTTFGPGDPDELVLTPLIDGPGGDASGNAGYTLVLGADGAIEQGASVDGYTTLLGAEPAPSGSATVALGGVLADRTARFNPDRPDEIVVAPLLPLAPLVVAARLDGAGVVTSVQRLLVGSGYTEVVDMEVTPDGGVVVLGRHQAPNDTVTFDPLGAAVTFRREGTIDSFVARFDVAGALVWARPLAGAGANVQCAGVVAFPDGDVGVTAFLGGTITLGAGEPTETTLASEGVADLLVARYAPSGALRWATQTTGSGYVQSLDAAAAPDGGLLVGGYYASGTAVFGPGEPTEVTLPATEVFVPLGFVARFEADGGFGWVSAMPGLNESSYATAALIEVRPDGEVLVAGTLRGQAVFGPGEPDETTLEGGPQGLHLAAYAPTGELRAARTLVNGTIGPRDLTLLSDGSVVVVGEFYQPSVFDPGLPTERALPHTEGFTPQPFMARWRP